MKVGDLVKNKSSLGIGIIVGLERPPFDAHGSYVRWFCFGGYVSLELNEMLEVLSEER